MPTRRGNCILRDLSCLLGIFCSKLLGFGETNDIIVNIMLKTNNFVVPKEKYMCHSTQKKLKFTCNLINNLPLFV